jgi:drug/metabolite transporter (DMT)-like permease
VKPKLPGPAIISLIVAVILWGSAPVGIRAGLRGYAPAQLTLFRFGIGSLILAIYAGFSGLRPLRKKDIPIVIAAAVIGITFYNVVLNYGLQTVSAGAASFLIASTPIWTSLLAIFFLHERLTILGWTGILVSFAGIALIANERGHGIHFSPGALIILIGAISYAGYMVLQKRLLATYPALDFTCYSFWIGTLFTIPFAGGLWHAVRTSPFSATLSVVYLGIFPAAIANFAWAYTMSHIPASRISSFLYVMPVVTIVIAWFWLHEVPTVLSIVGGILALIGVSIVNLWGHAAHEPVLLPEVLE